MKISLTPTVTVTYKKTTPHSSRSAALATVATIAALTVIAYIPALRAGFIWDDDKHITENRLLHDPSGLTTMWTQLDALPQYYPLTHTIFWVEYHLWGNSTLGFHLVNVLAHAANAGLVWLILRRLAVPGAALAAMLFALHPVNVETVAWVSEGKNTFSGFFYLLSLFAFLRTSHLNPPEARQDRDVQWYVLSLVFFICALLCKTVAASLPAAILLLIWYQQGHIRLRSVIALLPYFAIGLLLAINTAYIERTHVKAVGPDWQFASTLPGEAVARCLIAGRAVWFYLVKLCVPLGLAFEYPRWHISVASPIQYAFPLAVITAVLSLYLMRKLIGRGPLAGALFFVGTLVPALGFNNIFPMRYSLVADHFQYLACIGPLAIFAGGISYIATRRAGEFVPAELLIGILGVLTWFRCTTFHSSKELFGDAISKNPRGWMSQGNYGAILLDEKSLQQAAIHLRASIALHPNNPVMAVRMGELCIADGEPQAAVQWFRAAANMDPAYAEPHFRLALLLEKSDVGAAMNEFEIANNLQPRHAPARLAYGVMLGDHGRFSEAADQIGKAVEIDPQSKRARQALIWTLEQAGRLNEAADQINMLLALNPQDPAKLYSDLGIIESTRRRPAAAIEDFQKALLINPNLPDAKKRLDTLLHSATATQESRSPN